MPSSRTAPARSATGVAARFVSERAGAAPAGGGAARRQGPRRSPSESAGCDARPLVCFGGIESH
jgi:hypothetical protein